MLKLFSLFLLCTLPMALLSRLFGIFSRIHFPAPIQRAILSLYAWKYNVNCEEAEKPLSKYKNLNEFFTRSLKAKTRSLHKGATSFISPVDGKITRFGTIQSDTLSYFVSVKNNPYTMEELIKGTPSSDTSTSSDSGIYSTEDFIDGSYAILYLSPKDCHRIYTPFDSYVLGYSYVPGRLLPVQEWISQKLPSLFVRNERLVSFLSYKNTKIAMIKVGATNVGSIRVSYDTSIQTNSWWRMQSFCEYKKPIPVKKGDEFARFEMGSTVILLFPKKTIQFSRDIRISRTVHCGQKIADFII